jgi:hypothetical protein
VWSKYGPSIAFDSRKKWKFSSEQPVYLLIQSKPPCNNHHVDVQKPVKAALLLFQITITDVIWAFQGYGWLAAEDEKMMAWVAQVNQAAGAREVGGETGSWDEN